MFEKFKRQPPAIEKMYTADEINALLFNSLRRVGEDKPLGYLPSGFLTEVCGINIDDLKDELEEKGLIVKELSEKETDVTSGALFAYDNDALNRVLQSGRQVLERNGWPTEPDAFVQHLKVFAEDPDLYALIEDAYGDTKSKV